MTIASERTNSILQTREFLADLMHPGKTPGVPLKVREQARHLLKHFPTALDLDEVHKKAPDVFGKPETF